MRRIKLAAVSKNLALRFTNATQKRRTRHAKTPITGSELDDKLDIIEHVNLDHRTELRYLLQSFTSVEVGESSLPIIEELYQEGVVLRYQPAAIPTKVGNKTKTKTKTDKKTDGNRQNVTLDATDMTDDVASLKSNPTSQTVFIAFRIDATLEEQFFYLLYEAAIKQGETLMETKRRYFEVIASQRVSANMQRIHIKSQSPLPQQAPGHAFQMVLTTLKSQQTPRKLARSSQPLQKKLQPIKQKLSERYQEQIAKSPQAKQVITSLNRQAQLVLFAAFKRLPSRQRDKIARSTGRYQSRYYTLRQLGKDAMGNDDVYHGDIDVYLHGDTLGSQWARGLQSGDVIYSQRDISEHTAHLTQGQALLIADESSLPVVVACLEQWCNPVAPLVFCLTVDPSDQSYLSDGQLPANTQLYRQVTHGDRDAGVETVLAQLKQLAIAIDCAWGGLETAQAKVIRKYLREQYKLAGNKNQVKGYWRADSQR